jgi:hypothetical protein
VAAEGDAFMTTLLPPNALTGVRVGISVSDSPDLRRLGLIEAHFRLALGEIARCMLVAGGKLAYGGHLNPEGYTPFLIKEIQKYGQRDRPLLICLAWQEHRKMSLSELKANEAKLGLLGEIIYLDPDGQVIDCAHGRQEDPQPVSDPELLRHALTGMRHFMGRRIAGRILIGGKRHNFQGEIPGLMEEALITLERNQPLYLAGGFGGVTFNIIKALEVDDGNWLPRRSDAPDDDPRLIIGYERLQAKALTGLNNGLTDEENRHLAATHRPSEIAALVSLGLGRWKQQLDNTRP